MPEVLVATNPWVNIICLGEGEDSLLTLMNRIDAGEDYGDIRGLWIKERSGDWIRNEIRELEENLDKYPAPDRGLLYDASPVMAHFTAKSVITQRGCAYQCAFCFQPLMRKLYRGRGHLVRRHSPDYVMRQIEDMVAGYPTKSIHFRDDTFNLDPAYLERLLNLYHSRIRLPFTCNISCKHVTEELVFQLKAAGCTGVYYAFETGVEKMRLDVLQKRVTNAEFTEAARLLHKYRLDSITSILFGLPGETLDDAIATLEFNDRLGPTGTRESFLRMYRGTPIAEAALSRGLCTPSGKYQYEVNSDGEQVRYLKALADRPLGMLFLKLPFLIRFARPIIRLKMNRILGRFFTPFIWLAYSGERVFFKMSIWDIWNWKYFFASRKELLKEGL